MNSITRLLFVDEEPIMARLFCRIIGDDDRFVIETAADGEDALKKLRVYAADIVLTDVHMPRMDGITLLKEIIRRRPDIL